MTKSRVRRGWDSVVTDQGGFRCDIPQLFPIKLPAVATLRPDRQSRSAQTLHDTTNRKTTLSPMSCEQPRARLAGAGKLPHRPLDLVRAAFRCHWVRRLVVTLPARVFSSRSRPATARAIRRQPSSWEVDDTARASEALAAWFTGAHCITAVFGRFNWSLQHLDDGDVGSGRCGRGIRTPGGLRLNGFQDRRNRPLCHPSAGQARRSAETCAIAEFGGSGLSCCGAPAAQRLVANGEVAESG